MSNQVLGTIYSSIIEDVVNASRPDFEECGIDESVMDTLREVRWLDSGSESIEHAVHVSGNESRKRKEKREKGKKKGNENERRTKGER